MPKYHKIFWQKDDGDFSLVFLIFCLNLAKSKQIHRAKQNKQTKFSFLR